MSARTETTMRVRWRNLAEAEGRVASVKAALEEFRLVKESLVAATAQEASCSTERTCAPTWRIRTTNLRTP